MTVRPSFVISTVLSKISSTRRRQTERWLVDHHHRRAHHEPAAHGQHLLLAAAHRAGHLALAFRESGEEREHTVPRGVDLGAVPLEVCAHL
jgi:hypothetical protein